MKATYLLIILQLFTLQLWSTPLNETHQAEFSTAGFFMIPNTGREVYNMNPAWHFAKGDFAQAFHQAFNDSAWKVVSLPHGIDYLPFEASGCSNYQGIVWYRKHFKPKAEMKGKQVFVHFEAIMGKCKIWLNGKLLIEHFGGYLPVIADLSDGLLFDQENVIAVMADNSDDPMYPPGKAQNVLDFTYFGGIYRDCWLVVHQPVYITDPNFANDTASGGLFVSFDNVSEKQATIVLKTQIKNKTKQNFSGSVTYSLIDTHAKEVKTVVSKINIKNNSHYNDANLMEVINPQLWSPESPNLYQLQVLIKNNKGQIVDGYKRRIGIRSILFKGVDGFWLNGKPYPNPLIGANRHQDYAVVGNAVANSAHWRDAKKLRDAGIKVIRNAHCPQDPAFMDACDELGLFVINNTPGWQFFNEAPIFEQRVYQDIRNIVRRDRNHPCMWLWEPVLNETHFPTQFAENCNKIVHQEYPYPYCYTGTDYSAAGTSQFPVIFTHPNTGDGQHSEKKLDSTKTYFTREWGDNVDNWSAQNSPSRVNRAWGEIPMLVQAQHYAKPPYPYSSYDALWKTDRHHVGGTLWHAFDHQRGYHPDPFYGGLMDIFRQAKYSYYLFMAQRNPKENQNKLIQSGPMVFIAHEMTPFSPKHVSVYSNCDEVKLTVNKGGKSYRYQKSHHKEKGMPSPIIVFEDVFHFMDAAHEKLHPDDVFCLAEGYIDGKLCAQHKITPARRPDQIILYIDNEGQELKANGSDFVTIVAAIADKNGNIKRLSNHQIFFEISGEGRILGDQNTQTNPRVLNWGTAPVLIQSTTNPGKINVTAKVLFPGSQMPTSAQIELSSVKDVFPLLFESSLLTEQNTQLKIKQSKTNNTDLILNREIELLKKELNNLKLKEVEQQQKEFGEIK